MTDNGDTLARPKFPHLENLDRVLLALPAYLVQPVTVTEKIHGFNARVGRDADGALWYGGRNLAWAIDDPKGDALQGFRDLARTLDWLEPGVTVYGEWAGRGVQKGIDYGEGKKFYVFAERLGDGPVMTTVAILDQYWTRGLTCVPVIYEGSATRLDVLDALRKGESVVAPGQPTEGVVIAPAKPAFDRGHQVVAKFKSPAFEEVAHRPKERVDLTGDPVWIAAHDFAEKYATPMRMVHVLDQVYEALRGEWAGKLHESDDVDPLAPRQTGAVLRAFNEDVLREGKPDYDALPADARKLVGKSVNIQAKRLLDEARVEAAREAAEGAAMLEIA